MGGAATSRRWVAALTAAIVLAACGGGSRGRVAASDSEAAVSTTTTTSGTPTTSDTTPPSVATTTTAAPTTSVRQQQPAGAVALCFPHLDGAASPSAGPQTVDGWVSHLPPLLVLDRAGDLWVIGDGIATAWTPPGVGVLWARWDADGTIYASAVEGSAVVLLHLTGPGQSAVVTQLPYTVKADAPAGVCPINGYLAGFALGPEGLLLVSHSAGPLEHSCPAMPPGSPQTTDPWRCRSKEAVSFEVRTGGFRVKGKNLGMIIGGSSPTPIASDSRHRSAVALLIGPYLDVELLDRSAHGDYGGEQGVAFALSDDGSKVAFSPDGHEIRIVTTDTPHGQGDVIATTSAAITALAWGGDWLAVAHGTALALLDPATGKETAVTGFTAGSIVTMDWAP